MNKKIINIVILQAIIVIYTLSGVFAKYASGYSLLSVGFIKCYMMEILVLGVYAILWQQMLKRFDMSVAYANRSIALVWALVWSYVFFEDIITINNIVGTIIVISGMIVVNIDD